jgi:hypothetical protein
MHLSAPKPADSLNENNPDLLAWNRLCDPVDVVIEEDRGNGIAAGDWMIGEEYDGLTARRDLN